MVISELCANHKGDPDILEEMVELASRAGAKFCKIQTFFADDLADSWKEKDYDRLKASELSWDAHKDFVRWCQARNMIPMTSVYSKKYLPALHECGFKWIKIGSAQATDVDLIRYYISFGFQVIVSTGGHLVQQLPNIHPLAGVLHCVSKYPSAAWEANLSRIYELRKWFPSASVGFSDHTDPTSTFWEYPSKYAMCMGANFVEKHFTILHRTATKDGPVSIDFDQLKELCEFDRLPQEEKLKGLANIGLFIHPQAPEEFELISKYRGRWRREA